MDPTARIARWTGAAYLALGLAGMAGFLAVRPMLRDADPATTLANLVDHAPTAHLGIALELLVVIAQAAAALGFYALFRRDRPVAAYGTATFGMANATAILGSAALLVAASAVADDAALASSSGAAGTTVVLLTVADAFWVVGGVFFGLWLIPMGWFVLSTGRMPRALGWFLVAGGVGYVVGAVVEGAAPGLGSVADVLSVPATLGEFWMIAYLLVCGIRPSADLLSPPLPPQDPSVEAVAVG